MIELMVAAPASGSGKTLVTCALLRALARRGLTPCAFKCGPDYIDPMFHREVLGVESYNLDLFLAGEGAVRDLFSRSAAGHGAAIVEGVMGYYDGLGGITTRASAWHLADTLDLPVLLVLRPKGASLTLAAQVRGLLSFRENHHLLGILLNDCSPALAQRLSPMLEEETGLPVLGHLPHLAEGEIPSRHLGLYTAGEVKDLSRRAEVLAEELESHAGLDRLIPLCRRPERTFAPAPPARPICCRIAVARDEAFSFLYQENLDLLEREGAELAWFSPLHDHALPPDIGGLYLPGGYPERYAGPLSQNREMLAAVRSALLAGLPTVAECGGFLYLGQSLEDEKGNAWPMCGVLPGQGVKTPRLVRFGYATLTTQEDNLLFRRGESFPVHEFHYWDSTENGAACQAKKPFTGQGWDCCVGTGRLFAGFPHLYFPGCPQAPRRFVQAAADWQAKKEIRSL